MLIYNIESLKLSRYIVAVLHIHANIKIREHNFRKLCFFCLGNKSCITSNLLSASKSLHFEVTENKIRLENRF